jgi:hypothetical protein
VTGFADAEDASERLKPACDAAKHAVAEPAANQRNASRLVIAGIEAFRPFQIVMGPELPTRTKQLPMTSAQPAGELRKGRGKEHQHRDRKKHWCKPGGPVSYFSSGYQTYARQFW